MLAVEVSYDTVDGVDTFDSHLICSAKRGREKSIGGTLFFPRAGTSSQSVQDYMNELVGDMQFLGQEVFIINVFGREKKIEFDTRLPADINIICPSLLPYFATGAVEAFQRFHGPGPFLDKN